MDRRQETGKWCERKAEELLLAAGYVVTARNYRWKGGEIDLIAETSLAQGQWELVFVEVRGRDQWNSGSWIHGLESVTFPKRLKLARTASKYLANYRGEARSVRCDVITWDGQSFQHFKNAWHL